MRSYLYFDLNNPDEREAHMRCLKATDMVLVLWDMREQLFEGKMDITDFNLILDRHNVILDEIVS